MGERTTPRPRKSFSKLPHILDLPNLIAVQTESFEWFKTQGLKETIEDINPIEDYTGNYAVEFGDYQFNEPPLSLKECRDKDQTYAAPLFITVRFVNREIGRDPGAERLHGRLPHDDRAGHLHHQRHRARDRHPAGAVSGRLRHGRQGPDEAGAHRQPHAGPRLVAGVRDRQARSGLRPHRPQAQAAGHRLPARSGGHRFGADRRRPRLSSPRAPTRRSSISSTATRSSRPPSRRTPSARSRRPWSSCSRSSAPASRPRSRPAATCCGTSASIPSGTISPGSAGTS